MLKGLTIALCFLLTGCNSRIERLELKVEQLERELYSSQFEITYLIYKGSKWHSLCMQYAKTLGYRVGILGYKKIDGSITAHCSMHSPYIDGDVSLSVLEAFEKGITRYKR